MFLLTRWATCRCYWRLPLVASLSGSLLSSYKKDTWWILVGHFWNAFQSDNENYSAREPLQTKVVNDQTICKWRVNQDQTNNRFNFYWLLTRRPTRSCFWRLQLVSSLSGFHASFYDNIHIRFKMIFQRFLCSFYHIFPSSLSFLGYFCVGFIALLWKHRKEIVH